ncbi:MAG: hypothetical protein M0P69_15735 [Bacteroidales bacterium]|nr:hypothetical protein [Bacteroidales bacterium]
MLIYLLLGIAIGIIAESVYINNIMPIIQLHVELHKFKVTDVATAYDMNTKLQVFNFYREYPEAKPEPEFQENTNLMGFQIQNEDDEEEFEEDRMGFR